MNLAIFFDVQQAASQGIVETLKVSVELGRSDMPDYLELSRQLLVFQRGQSTSHEDIRTFA